MWVRAAKAFAARIPHPVRGGCRSSQTTQPLVGKAVYLSAQTVLVAAFLYPHS